MEPESIRDVARRILAGYQGESLGEAAALVATAWSEEQRTEAVRYAAERVVQDTWSSERQRVSADRPLRRTRIEGSPSSRVQGIRSWAAEARAIRVHVSLGIWRTLNECTGDELMFAAQERRALAEQNAAKAEQFERLAKALADAGAETVADLEDEVLRQILRDQEGAA